MGLVRELQSGGEQGVAEEEHGDVVLTSQGGLPLPAVSHLWHRVYQLRTDAGGVDQV